MAEQQRFITEDLIYVTKGCCPDCPFVCREEHKKVSSTVRKQMEQRALAGGHSLECTSVTVARMQGRRLPEIVCCYGYFYQYWSEVDALSYAVEKQHIRSIDITGWQSLSESTYKVYAPFTTESLAESGLPFCPTEEWEASHS